ncbi:hypothetical protein [Spirosoma endophyticum]|uniref:hypothetical protein n=1 Tax=Spirosoma endophyticum TaxID=662367 RepID=UPI0015A5F5F2|nr:hypothetical protein [Spirosoma endophyticum]
MKNKKLLNQYPALGVGAVGGGRNLLGFADAPVGLDHAELPSQKFHIIRPVASPVECCPAAIFPAYL